MSTIDLSVSNGALEEAPIWENHSRGKNWAAFIEVDPAAPGGLKRSFWQKARGGFTYLIPDEIIEAQDLKPVAIEFGADYYTGRGRKQSQRWYGIITYCDDRMMQILKCESARNAINQAENLQPEDKEVVAARKLRADIKEALEVISAERVREVIEEVLQ